MAGNRQGTGLALWLLAAGLAALGSGPVLAGDRETRAYTVYVDGKRAGEGHLVIDRQDDGTTVVDGATGVKVRVLFFNYSYWYRGREIWKNGRLQKLDSSSDDNGQRYMLSVVPEPTGLRVTVNGQTRLARTDVWTTSYWQLPEARLRGGRLLLLDVDTGSDIDARLDNLGEEHVSIGGRTQKTTHYRLTSKLSVDLWFDASERMVRQEWVEAGHRTIIELARTSR